MKSHIYLDKLKETARERPPGYYEDVLSRGEIIADNVLEIDPDELKKLAKIYHPGGAGTYIKKLLKPVVRAIDGVAGTDLENCPPCKRREMESNIAWNRFWTEGPLVRLSRKLKKLFF